MWTIRSGSCSRATVRGGSTTSPASVGREDLGKHPGFARHDSATDRSPFGGDVPPARLGPGRVGSTASRATSRRAGSPVLHVEATGQEDATRGADVDLLGPWGRGLGGHPQRPGFGQRCMTDEGRRRPRRGYAVVGGDFQHGAKMAAASGHRWVCGSPTHVERKKFHAAGDKCPKFGRWPSS